jgi:hypothetical protein
VPSGETLWSMVSLFFGVGARLPGIRAPQGLD